ncbi:MAG: hypothetical protein ACOYZ7_07230 [Chloroflexota bacterium]
MKNKLFTLTLTLLVSLLALTMAACGGATPAPADKTGAEATPAATATPAGETAAAALTDTYDDALTIKNQLLLGTLRLQDTAQAVTSEQAGELLVLWRAYAALTASGTAAEEETEAVQNQIIETMTPEQIGAIAAMRLTNASLQEFYIEVGITEVKTPEPDVTPQSTRNRDLPQEDREATRVASGEEVSSSSGSSKSSALLDRVIELLESR